MLFGLDDRHVHVIRATQLPAQERNLIQLFFDGVGYRYLFVVTSDHALHVVRRLANGNANLSRRELPSVTTVDRAFALLSALKALANI